MPIRWQVGEKAKNRLIEGEKIANHRLVREALDLIRLKEVDEGQLRIEEQAVLSEAADIAELACLDLLAQRQASELLDAETRQACEVAFRILLWISPPQVWNEQLKYILKTACLGLLAERTADTKRWLRGMKAFAIFESRKSSWAENVFYYVASAFLRDIRQSGWEDLDSVGADIDALRNAQAEYEAKYLRTFEDNAPRAAVELVAMYHWAKATELVSSFLALGNPDDIETQLGFHFQRANDAVLAGWLGEIGTLLFLTERVAFAMVARSVWRVVRPLGDRFAEFLRHVVDPESVRPIFELLPPQKQALDERLMDIARRAVVIQMPTSTGKTFLAELRILQTKQAFADAMIVYLVPTRALVNQITIRLRQELSPLGLQIEQAAPAFELDPTEEEFLLTPQAFDILVTTPEKMDLLVRSGRLNQIDRPLGLVILDEAHNIGGDERGLRTEILLATISREFPDARFLLLSPFVPNVDELGRWLGAEKNVSVSVQWRPNDKLVGLCFPFGKARNWGLRVETLYTPEETIHVDRANTLEVGQLRGEIDKPISQLAKRDIASVTAALLTKRGNVLVLCADLPEAHEVAKSVFNFLPKERYISKNLELVCNFIRTELGTDFLLSLLLPNRIAFHHAGLSPEARFLVEWLMAGNELQVLATTTTLAQGVNFPVASIILTSHTSHATYGNRPIGRLPMPMNQFWNIAGRSGRLDHDALGLVLFASKENERQVLSEYVNHKVESLASYLEEMVDKIIKEGSQLDLTILIRHPEWSTFTQFIAHAYRIANRPRDFVARTETILQSTFGYRRLRERQPTAAQLLLTATRQYAAQLEKTSENVLAAVDQTGFSPSTINTIFQQKDLISKSLEEWSPSGLFISGSHALRDMIGILLRVNELRFEAEEGGYGENIGRILSAWVRGAKVEDLAKDFFKKDNPTDSVTECCRRLFRSIIPSATWGLGALQALGLSQDNLSELPLAQQLEIRSIPAMIFYGVDTVDGVVMRNLNVPRIVAKEMGERFRKDVPELSHRIGRAKTWLREQLPSTWQAATPADSLLKGHDLQRIWSIINGYEP